MVPAGDACQDMISKSTVHLHLEGFRVNGPMCVRTPRVCQAAQVSFGSTAYFREIGRLGLSLTDQTCHHEVWTHLSHVSTLLTERSGDPTAPQTRLFSSAEVRKDTGSPIDVGKAEDFQQWSKKTQAFSARVMKESEMMLQWSAEQVTEITQEHFGTATNVERCVFKLEFVLQCMHTALMAVTSCELHNIAATSRKNPFEAWRRLQNRNDMTTGGRKRNLLRTTISLGRCFLLELQAGWYRTMGILRLALREKVEGHFGR